MTLAPHVTHLLEAALSRSVPLQGARKSFSLSVRNRTTSSVLNARMSLMLRRQPGQLRRTRELSGGALRTKSGRVTVGEFPGHFL